MREEKRRSIRKYGGTRLLTPRPLALQLRRAKASDAAQQVEIANEVGAQQGEGAQPRDMRQARESTPTGGQTIRERDAHAGDPGVAEGSQEEGENAKMEVGALAAERSQVVPISAQLQEVRDQLEAASRAVSRASALLVAWSQEGMQEPAETQHSDGTQRVPHAQDGQGGVQAREQVGAQAQEHASQAQSHFQGAFRRDRFRR